MTDSTGSYVIRIAPDRESEQQYIWFMGDISIWPNGSLNVSHSCHKSLAREYQTLQACALATSILQSVGLTVEAEFVK